MDAQVVYPINDQIEPDQARFLYRSHCAILIVEDLPVNSEFGIDLSVYRTGDRFKGVKLIPPGIHFIYASACDKNTQQLGPRCGFYYNFSVKELVVKRWSCHEEDFDDSYEPSEEHKQRYASNLEDLDSYLGVYQFSCYSSFLKLTNKLSWPLVEDLMPKSNRIRSVPYLVRREEGEGEEEEEAGRGCGPSSVTRRPRNVVDLAGERTVLPDLRPSKASLIRFSRIPDSNEVRQYLEAADYRLIPIKRLEAAFKGGQGRQRLLGELQFAFVTLILGQVYDCFERWVHLLELVFMAAGCEDNSPFYLHFIDVLRIQLDELPEELFADISSSSASSSSSSSSSSKNLVGDLLEKFFNSILDSTSAANEDLELARKVAELRAFVESKFGWQFELDDNEPVVV